MNENSFKIKGVIFDWAGTTVDYGSRAPVQAFVESFRTSGVEITTAEARGPMGRAKRDHIAAIIAVPRVADAWQKRHGKPPHDPDIDRLYDEFLPLQKEIIARHCDVIPGVPETVAECRRRGMKIGSTTGYTRELMEIVTPLAGAGGYEPDVVLCAEDAPQGRPAPWLIFRTAERLNVYPVRSLVIVDDTPVGIAAGVNAGAWTVAVIKTGNCLGLSEQEVNQLPSADLQSRLAQARGTMQQAGADFVIDGVADLIPVLDEIEGRLRGGK